MENEIMFSIIVPVYNTEQYLIKCMDSILGQAYQKFEVIAVNDGSTDACPKILNRYAERDARVKVIHKKNGGIGSACACGIEVAQGDYICFVDSDDYIENNMLQIICNKLQETDADVVQFGLRMVNAEGECLKKQVPTPSVFTGRSEIMEKYFVQKQSPSLACRIFKNEMFNDVEFIPQSTGIDEATILQVLSKSKKCVSIENIMYNVLVRAGSISRSVYTTKKIEENLWLYDYMINYTVKELPEYKKYVMLKYMSLLMALYRTCDEEGLKAKRKVLRQEFGKCDRELRFTTVWKQEPLRFRVAATLFRLSPDLYRKLRNGNK